MPTETVTPEEFMRLYGNKPTGRNKRVLDKHYGGIPPVLETRCAAPRKPRTRIVEVRPGEPVQSVTCVITGWPPSVNRKSGEHWRVVAQRVREYHDHAAPYWREAMAGKAFNCQRLAIHVEYFGASRSDPHNSDKAAYDAAANAVGFNDRNFSPWGGEWNVRAGERSHKVTLTAILG